MCTSSRTLAGEGFSDDRTDVKGTEKCVNLHFNRCQQSPTTPGSPPRASDVDAQSREATGRVNSLECGGGG